MQSFTSGMYNTGEFAKNPTAISNVTVGQCIAFRVNSLHAKIPLIVSIILK